VGPYKIHSPAAAVVEVLDCEVDAELEVALDEEVEVGPDDDVEDDDDEVDEDDEDVDEDEDDEDENCSAVACNNSLTPTLAGHVATRVKQA